MRVFLDANVLFSAAKSNGAIRQLLDALQAGGHVLVADGYVATEARRNVAAKASSESLAWLEALLARIEVGQVLRHDAASPLAAWLPEKDRPVLLAAIVLKCDALVTGDRTHFGVGYGQVFGGVTVWSPAQLALAVLGPAPSIRSNVSPAE